MSTISKLLPDSFYAGLPDEQRLEKMIANHNRAIKLLQEYQGVTPLTHNPELSGLEPEDFSAGLILILEDEQGMLFFDNALCQPEGEWLVVYTEHCGYHSFPREAISSIKYIKD